VSAKDDEPGQRQPEAPAIHPDVYPVVRVSTEFFMRAFDLLGQLHPEVISGLIVMTLWHGWLQAPQRKPMSIRELSRRLDLPYETVRRHVRDLIGSGHCVAAGDGIAVAPVIRHGARATAMLRKTYLNTARLLNDLTRIEVVDFKEEASPPARSRRLGRQQMVIAVSAIGLLLEAMKMVRGVFGGDLVKGLVFTAIRAANVQHITNTSPTTHRSFVPDAERVPVTAMAIADSMRLPYETVRRHADALVKEGKLVRFGRQGVKVPETAFRNMTVESVTVHKLVTSFITELRFNGVNV
jgi:DNA-binding Lrp family transcriptional regulator